MRHSRPHRRTAESGGEQSFAEAGASAEVAPTAVICRTAPIRRVDLLNRLGPAQTGHSWRVNQEFRPVPTPHHINELLSAVLALLLWDMVLRTRGPGTFPESPGDRHE